MASALLLDTHPKEKERKSPTEWVSEWVSSVLRPHQHSIGYTGQLKCNWRFNWKSTGVINSERSHEQFEETTEDDVPIITFWSSDINDKAKHRNKSKNKHDQRQQRNTERLLIPQFTGSKSNKEHQQHRNHYTTTWYYSQYRTIPSKQAITLPLQRLIWLQNDSITIVFLYLCHQF